jgi:two-component system, cell cycle response regulator
MRPTILIAEDDYVSRLALQRLLERWGHTVQVARDGEEAWEMLSQEGSPRLAILDWMMPGLDGLEVCRRVRGLDLDGYTYILILTGRDQKADMISALEGGADDYLTKPVDRRELAARLATGQRILDLQSQLLATRERLQREATHDALTGLWNRRAGRDELERCVARAARNHAPLAVAVADVDHFKAVNDSCGHPVGDEVLVEVGRRLRAAMRAGETVARWGGEEFLVVMPGADAGQARDLADRLRRVIAAPPIATTAGPLSITMSWGVAAALAPEAGTGDDLVHLADGALYAAKRRGRNRVESCAAERPRLVPPERLAPAVASGGVR